MKNTLAVLAFSLVSSSLLVMGCTVDMKADEVPLASLGEGCAVDEDCESGLLCAEVPDIWIPVQYCTQTCSTTNPCPTGMVCTAMHYGQLLCVNPCTASFQFYNEDYDPDYACVDGVPTWCLNAPYGEYCHDCGCNPGEYCNVDSDPDTCLPMVSTGEPCDSDEACTTKHCGIPASGGEMQCLAEIGTSCTDDNCELCLTGGAFCTRHCESDSRCPDDMLCAGRGGSYWCLLDCGSAECCRLFPDCGYCHAVDAACPAGQECLAIEWEYVVVNYGCYDL